MNKLYIAEIEPLTEEALYKEALSLVGEMRREQAAKMRNPSDKARSIAAGLLLHYAVVRNAGMRNAAVRDTGMENAAARNADMPAGRIEDAGMQDANIHAHCIKDVGTQQHGCEREDDIWHAGITWDGNYHVGEHGKPQLPREYGLYFNLSHSGKYAVCAISAHNIGTDIQIHQGERESLARRFFHPEELEVLKTAADPMKCFYDLWCLKESYIKYTGRGLGTGLDRFSVVPFYLHKELWIDGVCCMGVCDPGFIRLDLRELIEHKSCSESAETGPIEGYSLAVVTPAG